MILSVTGHRPPKLGGYDIPNPTYLAVTNALADYFRQERPERVIIGMALGVDQWAAQICLNLGIPFTAAVPFIDFDSQWPQSSQMEYRRLLREADRVHTVSDTREYRPGLMQRRNEWMVDNSDRLIAVWNGSSGGTQNCVNYAVRRRKPWSRLILPNYVWEEARRVELVLEERRRLRRGATAPGPQLTQPIRMMPMRRQPLPMPAAVPTPPMPMDLPPPAPIPVPAEANSPDEAERILREILGAGRIAASRRAGRSRILDQVADEMANQVAREMPRPEPMREEPVRKPLISEEKRFQPARLIDLDDE